ncbi:MAG: hypothetical protein R2706_03310 [Acidimicrobiales bacterium]
MSSLQHKVLNGLAVDFVDLGFFDDRSTVMGVDDAVAGFERHLTPLQERTSKDGRQEVICHIPERDFAHELAARDDCDRRSHNAQDQ